MLWPAFIERLNKSMASGKAASNCGHTTIHGGVWSKPKKDELDLIRLAEAYPELKSIYPDELREQIDRG
jgi:hypothetical protein